MNHEEAARKLGVDPASLTPAPAAPHFAEIWARMQQEPPCSACGQPSRTVAQALRADGLPAVLLLPVVEPAGARQRGEHQGDEDRVTPAISARGEVAPSALNAFDITFDGRLSAARQ